MATPITQSIITMPSDNMVRYPVDIYPEQDRELQKLVNTYKLKRSRFLRECVAYVISNENRLSTVITQSKQKTYVKVKR